jgi:hypothetical protein
MSCFLHMGYETRSLQIQTFIFSRFVLLVECAYLCPVFCIWDMKPGHCKYRHLFLVNLFYWLSVPIYVLFFAYGICNKVMQKPGHCKIQTFIFSRFVLLVECAYLCPVFCIWDMKPGHYKIQTFIF